MGSALGSLGLCDGGSVYHYFLGGHGIELPFFEL